MSDPRFARLKSDPRFRRPKKKSQKVVIDERFKSVFTNDKKKNAGRKVDKYGRSVSSTQEQEDLRRYYRLEGDAAEEDEIPRKPDLARGQVLLESSDEEQDQDQDENSDSDDGGFVTLGADSSRPIAVEDEDAEIDLDEDNYADLDAQAANYSKVHADKDEQPNSAPTSRLAIVNLDWDHVRASHLYKICSSLVSPTAPALTSSLPRSESSRRKSGKGYVKGQVTVVRGKVLSVHVYPSDFGKKRLEREEKEGPPSEIFKKREDLDVDEVNEKTVYEVGEEEEYNEDALRKYQLERLRYYYAIVTCDTADAASHIYNELEGTELERSANVFDMSFVPEDMTFENEPRDEATEEDINGNYKAVEFVTDALRHSKVKLTWDDDDPERLNVTRRAFSQKEIEESDFRAYLANSSSESEEEEVSKKKSDKRASREKLRTLLLGGNNEAMPEGWGDGDNVDDVDMEITFTPGLSDKKNPEDETTLERYQRKMREKRKKRKEEVKEAVKEKKLEDDFFEPDSEDEPEQGEGKKLYKGKKQRAENGEAEQESSIRIEATAEELELLVTSENPTAEPKHFNLKAVIKSEKQKKRRKGKKVKTEEDNEAQENFIMDVKDERFKALFEDHQFAIDPTNPQFKKTKAMTALLDERQKRMHERRGSQDGHVTNKAKDTTGNSTNSLRSLVESVKRKSVNADIPGQGKRRKL